MKVKPIDSTNSFETVNESNMKGKVVIVVAITIIKSWLKRSNREFIGGCAF